MCVHCLYSQQQARSQGGARPPLPPPPGYGPAAVNINSVHTHTATVCGCSVDIGSTTNSVSETCVLAETEAIDYIARIAVTSGDNTGSGGVLA